VRNGTFWNKTTNFGMVTVVVSISDLGLVSNSFKLVIERSRKKKFRGDGFKIRRSVILWFFLGF
jgi:hypothetical protein